MPTPPFYTKFPDIDAARNSIQRDARSLDDVVDWVRTNGWFFAAIHLRAHQRVWSSNRQRIFYRDHRDFKFSEFTLVSAGNGLRALSGFFDTDLTYAHVKKHARDEVDQHEGLRILGLTGSGGGHFGGDTIHGQLGVRVRATDWHFLASPCILASIGSSVWNAHTMGADRWYPEADLDSLHRLQQSIRVDRSIIREQARALMSDTPTALLISLPELSMSL